MPSYTADAVAAATKMALATADLDGRHIWFNQSYAAITNLEAGSFPNLRDALGHPADFDTHWSRIRTGQSTELSVEVTDAFGIPSFYRVQLDPVRDPDGESHQVAVAVVDESSFRRALADLQRYASMVTYSMVAIMMVDARGNIETWNAGAQDLYGYTADDVIGKPLTMLASDSVAFLDDLTERVLQGEVIEGEDPHKCRDGTIVRVSLQASPTYHRVEGINGMSIVARDITERYQMEAELRAAKDRAEQAARAKSRFLANMSHEIRTPMNGVLGMADLLLETRLSREQQEYAEAVKTSGDALLQLINDILDFSKIEAGRLELEDIPFDIGAVCNGVLDLLAQFAAEKSLELTGFVDLDLPTRIMGDPSRLRQVLLNLTNNAIKFTSDGDVRLRVDPVGQDCVRFEVTDTGIGIPADRVDRLFRAFSQVDSSTTRRFGGTGLGLAISRELVEMMGGTLKVESTEGVGSRFWFDLPLRQEAPTRELPVLAQPSMLEGLRILVVDDVAASREIIARYCEAWGCAVVLAESGDRATELLYRAEAERRPFSVVMLDNGLPGQSGLELGRKWAARPTDGPQLVLLTSFAQRGDARRAYEAGFAAYLSKPTKMRTLKDVLLTVLGSEAANRPTSRRQLVTRHSVAEDRRRTTRVLVAEDNPVNQKVALRMLERIGYQPTLAEDGQVAVEMFAAQAFDVVFMDCDMPRLDGFQATAALRTLNEAGARVPIIAMTANAMAGDRERCLASGMTHYVSKPVSARALSEILDEVLEGSSASA